MTGVQTAQSHIPSPFNWRERPDAPVTESKPTKHKQTNTNRDFYVSGDYLVRLVAGEGMTIAEIEKAAGMRNKTVQVRMRELAVQGRVKAFRRDTDYRVLRYRSPAS